MKEPHGEGLAIHADPESCGASREGRAEALTGAHVGRVLSRETGRDRGADVVQMDGRQHGLERYRELLSSPAWSKTPRMRGIFMRENREASRPPAADGVVGRIGKAKAVIR
jgi:hypothetical protein